MLFIGDVVGAAGMTAVKSMLPDAISQSRRAAANDWFDSTLYSRLNDKEKGAIVIVMQRLHEDDLAGHVLGQGGWEVVSFPAVAEDDEAHAIETPGLR